MARLVSRVLGVVATLAFVAVALLAVVALHPPDPSGPSSSSDGVCAAPPPDAGTGDRTVALAGRTYDAFAGVIEAVSDRGTADLWRSVFATCGGAAAFDPDGTPGPG
jgi:hypothetical protein